MYTILCYTLLCNNTQYYHTIPYHTIPYHTIPYHTIPYHTIPYHTIPYHTIPYHTIAFRARLDDAMQPEDGAGPRLLRPSELFGKIFCGPQADKVQLFPGNPRLKNG